MASAEQHFGRVDVVIAAAGIALGSSRPRDMHLDPRLRRPVASAHSTFFKTPMTEEALDQTYIHFTGNRDPCGSSSTLTSWSDIVHGP